MMHRHTNNNVLFTNLDKTSVRMSSFIFEKILGLSPVQLFGKLFMESKVYLSEIKKKCEMIELYLFISFDLWKYSNPLLVFPYAITLSFRDTTKTFQRTYCVDAHICRKFWLNFRGGLGDGWDNAPFGLRNSTYIKHKTDFFIHLFFLRIMSRLNLEKYTTETICQCSSSETAHQNVMKLCSYERHFVQMHVCRNLIYWKMPLLNFT